MTGAKTNDAHHVRSTPKVFCVGFHRTGTTTMHRAFEILGYVAIHSAPVEIASQPQSAILDQHSAFTDLPFPLMYRELDRRFPTARFILIERDADTWLASCAHLFSRSAEWNEDAHRLHELVYGRRTFEGRTMKERYLRHNREVMDYFRGRSTFLVMNLEKGDGWRALCAFLDKPIPGVPFPHLNQRGKWYW